MSVDELDKKLAKRFAALRNEDRGAMPPPPSFEAPKLARPRHMRATRPAYAAAAALFAVVAIGAVLVVTQPRHAPDPTLFAMNALPTTDWLLDTPRTDELLRPPTQINKELTDEK